MQSMKLLFTLALSALCLSQAAAEAQEQELVSVVIPTFNRSPFLMFALQEVILHQTYKNVEVIAVDDSPVCLSLHALHAVLPEEADRSRVHYICKNDRRYTVGEKRNIAVAESKGSIIAFWDDSDAYPRFRLERQVAELQTKSVDIVSLMFSHVLAVNETGSFLYEVQNAAHFGAHFGTLMMRRAVVEGEKAVKFPATALAEDYAIVERALALGYKFSTMQMQWAYTRMGNDEEFSQDRVGSSLVLVAEQPEWLPTSTVEFFAAARELAQSEAEAGNGRTVMNRYPAQETAPGVRKLNSRQVSYVDDSDTIDSSTASVYGGVYYDSVSTFAYRYQYAP